MKFTDDFEIAKEEGYKEGFIAGKKALSKETELSLDDMSDDLKMYGKTYKAGYSNGYKSGFDDGYEQGKQKEAENMKEICAPVMENITKEMGYQRALDEIKSVLNEFYLHDHLCAVLNYFIDYRKKCNPYKADADNKGLDKNGNIDLKQFRQYLDKMLDKELEFIDKFNKAYSEDENFDFDKLYDEAFGEEMEK